MAKELFFEIMDMENQDLVKFNNFHGDYFIEHDYRGNNYIRFINHVDCVANYHYVFDLMGMIEKKFFSNELKQKPDIPIRDQRRFLMEIKGKGLKEIRYEQQVTDKQTVRNYYTMTQVWGQIWNSLHTNGHRTLDLNFRRLSLTNVYQSRITGYLPNQFPFGFPLYYPTGYFEVGIQIEYPYRHYHIVDEKEFIFDLLKNDVSIRLTETIGGFLQGFDYRTIYMENISNVTKDIISILYHANDYILKQLQLTDAPDENLPVLPTGSVLPRLSFL